MKADSKKDEKKTVLEEEGAEFSDFPEITSKSIGLLKERNINRLFSI
jgi:hypothetical protein